MVNNDQNNQNNSSVNEKDTIHDPGRRRFMKNTGMVIGGVAGGSLLGGFLTNQFQSKPDTAVKDTTANQTPGIARMFFTRFSDFVVLEQAAERIYPEDHNGPGAIELGVPYFIDKQLAGSWGMNAKDYRHSPFAGADAEAVDSRLTRGTLFLEGLRKMNTLSQERFDTTFDKAEEAQQLEILQDFQDNKVKLNGVNSSSFFEMLRMSVLEGAYADPLYGGNIDMAGWKMKEFPGSYPSYMNIIESDEFAKLDPISLTDYQQKS